MKDLFTTLNAGNLAGAQKAYASSPASVQANANNQQVASTLSMLRGQGGQIDTLV
jgi:hypothetical protein